MFTIIIYYTQSQCLHVKRRNSRHQNNTTFYLILTYKERKLFMTLLQLNLNLIQILLKNYQLKSNTLS